MDLTQLPPELLIRVSSYLTTLELGSFRRTCKYIESALFDSFAREFFTKRQFMIEQVSLQALIDIANHPTLSKRVSEVIIATHIFDWTKPTTDYAEHAVLLATGQARDMLVEAFSKLPNLRTVGLRDYHAKGRLRDGKEAVWRTWGWSHSSSYNHPQLDVVSPEAIVPLMLYTLGCARARPDSFEVFLRKRGEFLTAASFNVFVGFMAEKVIPVLAGLKTLMLTISLDSETPFDERTDEMTDSLKRLFHHLPNLETLRLNFEPNQVLASQFLNWLGFDVSGITFEGKKIDPLLPPVPLSNLTRLDLGLLSSTSHVLIELITKPAALVTLNLWKVNLYAFQQKDLGSDHWCYLLRTLSEELPDTSPLASVFIGFPTIKEVWTENARSNGVRFATKSVRDSQADERDGKIVIQKDKWDDKATFHAGQGLTVKEWLEEMSTRTFCFEDKSDNDDISIGDEDDDDDDDDSDDDDEEEDEEEYWDQLMLTHRLAELSSSEDDEESHDDEPAP